MKVTRAVEQLSCKLFNNVISLENLIITIVLINSYHSPRYDPTCIHSALIMFAIQQK